MFEIYQEEPKEKKFALQLKRFSNNVHVNAVDINSGKMICSFVVFDKYGIWATAGAKRLLLDDGYDITDIPFDSNGAIKIGSYDI